MIKKEKNKYIKDEIGGLLEIDNNIIQDVHVPIQDTTGVHVKIKAISY